MTIYLLVVYTSADDEEAPYRVLAGYRTYLRATLGLGQRAAAVPGDADRLDIITVEVP